MKFTFLEGGGRVKAWEPGFSCYLSGLRWRCNLHSNFFARELRQTAGSQFFFPKKAQDSKIPQEPGQNWEKWLDFGIF